MRVPQRLRDRQRGAIRDRPLDRILQHRSPAFDARRQDARRGLCYASTRGEIGGVIKPRIHLSQAAILSRKSGPPQQRRSYEKPSERKNREKAEAVRRARKLARKKAQREGLIPDTRKKKPLDEKKAWQRPPR